MGKNPKEIEQTQLAADFQQQAKNYEDYQAAINQLVIRLEKVLSINKEISKRKDNQEEDPLDRLSMVLKGYSNIITDMPKDDEGKLNKSKENIVKMAEFFDSVSPFKKRIRKIHRILLHPLRKFHSKVFPKYQEKWHDLEAARNKMDLAKFDIKQAKNTEEIEERAVVYKKAVEQFDRQCTEVVKILEELPKEQGAHVDALSKWMIALRDYHQKMAECC